MDKTLSVNLILNELERATKKFPPFNSAHEGYAVLLEELEELWTEIKHKPKNKLKMSSECIQVGAMAIRFLMDVIK